MAQMGTDAVADSEHSLASLLCALSFATGLSLGDREDHGLKAAYIAIRLAERLGLSAEEKEAVWYGALLKDVGCTACAANFASFFPSTDRGPGIDMLTVDMTRMTDMLQWMNVHARRDRQFPERIARMLAFMAQCSAVIQESMRGHCETGALFAARLGFSQAVQDTLHYQLERWDGKSPAYHRKGEATPVAARILNLAVPSELAHAFIGVSGMTALIQEGKGKRFDPLLVSALEDLCSEPGFLRLLDADDERATLLEMRPPTPLDQRDHNLESTCEALADLVDLKTRMTTPHSRTVAHVAKGLAEAIGWQQDACAHMWHAGLAHDLGKVCIPYGTLTKQANHERLTAREAELIRWHAHYSERLLLQIPALRHLAPIVGAHHEYWDGTGYHRGTTGDNIPAEGQVLAVAEAYVELRDSSRDAEESITQLRKQSGVNFNPNLIAGLEAWIRGTSAHMPPKRASQRLQDLTEREREVLKCLVSGLNNREIAAELVISRKTVEHHLEHIYAKMDVSCRTAAVACALTEDLAM